MSRTDARGPVPRLRIRSAEVPEVAGGGGGGGTSLGEWEQKTSCVSLFFQII